VSASLLAACSGPVEITQHELSAADAAACEAFVDALPDTLDRQERVEVTPEGAPGAAYGDPPIVVTCGVPQVPEFAPGIACEIANDVRWYIPADQFGLEPTDITITSAWDTPHIRVEVPAGYWPEGSASVMSALAPLVDEHLESQPGECY
jgi:hypothetical protein